MKTSAWLAWPVLAISTSALVIHSTTDASRDVATVAGSTASTNLTDSTKTLLELEYENLEILKHRLHDLHYEVLRKERDILHIINHDFRSCAGVKCYLQTALKKAPDFYELFKTHFRHDAKNATGCPWSSNSSWILTNAQPLESPEGPFKLDDGPAPPSSVDFDRHHPPPPPPPPPPHPHPHSPPHPASFDFGDEKPDHHHPGHHGPPPHHESHDPHRPDGMGPSHHGHKPHHERPPFHMPHPAPRPRYFKLILATAGLVISLLILAAFFKGLRIYLANPRVRAERAARIEECRTRREYRRAACQHRFKQVISRFRRRSRTLSTDDYEEKRAMLQARNTIAATSPTANMEDHIIGSNIASLRRAHELVGQLMLAEEGRSHSFSFATTEQQHQQQRQPNPHLPSSSHSVHSMHTTTTLPAYIPPPRYSQELAREIHDVVDGFRYTPTSSGVTPSEPSSPSTFMIDDDENDRHMQHDHDHDHDHDIDGFTESSVADCISRMSMATETEGDAEAVRGRFREKGDFELAGDRYIGRFD